MSETVTPVAPATPAAIVTETPAPLPDVPRETQASEAVPSAAAEAAAPVSPPASPDAPAAVAEPPDHSKEPTLLEGFELKPPPEAPKPDEAPKPAEAEAPAEAKPAETPEAKPAPVYEPFTLPEGVTAAPEQMTAYTETLGKFGISQEAGQALIDMHAQAVQDLATNSLAEQHRVFGQMRKEWQERIKSDPELGGAGHDTAKGAVARMRDLLVPEAHRAEFNEFLQITGAGDHPALWRILHRAARLFDEPAIPDRPIGPAPNAGAPRGRNGFRGVMYDHPSSQQTRN